jgi:hypothetical protein
MPLRGTLFFMGVPPFFSGVSGGSARSNSSGDSGGPHWMVRRRPVAENCREGTWFASSRSNGTTYKLFAA